MTARPFIRWVGGKAHLVHTIGEQVRRSEIRTYFEPFVGGGALFFHLKQQRDVHLAVLGDLNAELVNLYKVVRDFPRALLDRLEKRQAEYNREGETAYYRWREVVHNWTDPIEAAARTVALNKTCFNGLYRLNRAGRFNVSWGRVKNPTIVDTDNILACSEVLQSGSRLMHADFAETVKGAGEGDVVYLDPPFVSDWQDFSTSDFYRLEICFREMVDRGAIVVLSIDSNDMTRRLYGTWDVLEVESRQGLKAKPSKELIVVGYPE